MSNGSSILPVPQLLPAIKEAVNSKKLAVLAGAGVSRIIGCKGWDELARELVTVCYSEKLISFKEKETLHELSDHKKTITICRHILGKAGKTEEFYGKLEEALAASEDKCRDFPIYDQIYRLRALCVTTNMDTYFDALFQGKSIIYKAEDFSVKHIDHTRLYHLHGTITDQSSLVLTVKDYFDRYHTPDIEAFLRHLFSHYTVLFLGYGLAEFELLDFLMGKNQGTGTEVRHFCLMPFYEGENNIVDFEQKYFGDMGIGVIPYAKDERGYEQLFHVLEAWNKEIDLFSRYLYDSYRLIEDGVTQYDPGTADQLFQIIRNDPPQEAHFFQKVSSPDWLVPLKERGYFSPERNPQPQEVANQPGHYTIPHWNVLDYLEKVANQVGESARDDIGDTLMEIIRSVSDYRDGKGERIDNYGTDWSFVKIISKLPVRFLDLWDIERVKVCLGTGWGVDLVGSEIGESLLPKLIKEHAGDLAAQLLEVSIGFRVEERRGQREVEPLIDKYWLNDMMEKNKSALQELFPLKAARITLKKMEEIVCQKQSLFSIGWLSAIEDHPQNWLPGEYQNVLIRAARDFLDAAATEDPVATGSILEELLGKKHPIFQRLALHTVATHWGDYSDLFWGFARPALLGNVHLKHEVYELLRLNFNRFSDEQRHNIISWIRRHPRRMPKEPNWNTEDKKKYRAYRKLGWLSALRQSGDPVVLNLYQRYRSIAGQEPDHPSFSVWHSEIRRVAESSPVEATQMLDMTSADLAQYLQNFQGATKPGVDEPSKEGLASTLRRTVADNPQKFAAGLQPFLSVDPLYQDSILSGFSDAWKAKNEFDWQTVLSFCREIVVSEGFWTQEWENRYDFRDAIICDIAELIEEGTGDDSHAFDAAALPLAEEVLIQLLNRTESRVSAEGDLWFQVHNTGKGRVLSATINYSVRYARLAKSTNGGNRWAKKIKEDFTRRLDHSFDDSLEFSFILGEYLRNLYYLDEQWVKSNINIIFPKDNDRHWHAAFSGYFAGRGVYDVLYDLLRSNEHYAKALSTNFTDPHSKESLVHHLCIGYLQGKEAVGDVGSLFSRLMLKWNTSDLKTIVYFFWAQRGQLESIQQERVISFWKKVFQHCRKKSPNTWTAGERELVSDLVTLTCFLGGITSTSLEWLKLSAPHVEVNHNSSFFLEELDRLVAVSPREVGLVYREMLRNGVYPIYKKDNVISTVEALYDAGEKELADGICVAYEKAGHDFLRFIWERYNEAQ